MASEATAIAYVTDVEGMWERLESFALDNPHVSIDARGEITLAPNTTFVYGGDAIDRGPASRRVLQSLLAAKRRYGDRVVLIAGNRDINKLRLRRELGGHPHRRAPAGLARAELLRWTFAHTMGAGEAFEHWRRGLEASNEPHSDDDVVESVLEDLRTTGLLTEYVAACQLAYHAAGTLFVHGAVTEESLGAVPGIDARVTDVDTWIAGLNAWYHTEVDAYRDEWLDREGTPGWARLVAYQAPVPGTRENQGSVVYGRLTDADGNPHLPQGCVIERLARAGISRVVVGHTPSGDSPSVLRADDGFELVVADNSHARISTGSQLVCTSDRIEIRARALLDCGDIARVSFGLARGDKASPIGKRDKRSGHLVRGLVGDEYLLFRGLPKYEIEQFTAPASDIAGRTLAAPVQPETCSNACANPPSSG